METLYFISNGEDPYPLPPFSLFFFLPFFFLLPERSLSPFLSFFFFLSSSCFLNVPCCTFLLFTTPSLSFLLFQFYTYPFIFFFFHRLFLSVLFSFSFSLFPLKHNLILFSVLPWWRLRLVVQGVAREKFSATCGLRSALEWSRRELVPATWRLGWLVLQSGLLEVSGFWLKWVDLIFFFSFWVCIVDARDWCLGHGGCGFWCVGDRFVERNGWLFCNGREQEREKQKSLRRRERKWEKKIRWASNGNKLGLTKKLSLDLNPVGFKNSWTDELKFAMRLT